MNNNQYVIGKWLRIIALFVSMNYAFIGFKNNNISALLFAIWLIAGVILITLVIKFGDD